MTLSKYILVNISNLSFYLLNIVIICYSGVTIKENFDTYNGTDLEDSNNLKDSNNLNNLDNFLSEKK